MPKIWKKNDEIVFESPQTTLGFSRVRDYNRLPLSQEFQIKQYDFSSVKQINDIKKQLLKSKILIIDAKTILEEKKVSISELKRFIEELKLFLRENGGGSLGRLGDQYLLITPNSQIRFSN